MKKLLIALLFFCNFAHAIDLRAYFPVTTNTYLSANGTNNARYTFSQDGSFNAFYNAFFNLNKAGEVMVWKKDYWINGWCTKDYGLIFKGADQSMTEVGDYVTTGNAVGCAPSVAFGYKTFDSPPKNTGLNWSPSGGSFINVAYYGEMQIFSQATVGAAYTASGQAYSKAGVIEVLPTFKAAFGRGADGVWCAGCGKPYTDVVHMVMYHGSKVASTVKVECGTFAPLTANGVYYQGFKNYNGYAIELWLDKTKGIIQEVIPWIADGSYFGYPNCTYNTNDNGLAKFIDDVY
jgi:hypothetical protein